MAFYFGDYEEDFEEEDFYEEEETCGYRSLEDEMADNGVSWHDFL